MAAQFDQYSDVIDSRDVIERLAELHDEMDAATTIDWDQYAHDLQTEYMDVEFRGVTYWIAC